MKRRNAESGKMRRPVKRTKITEGMYGNSLLYLKFVMLWATVVLADYMLEFRFEFLWPFWMMLRSVYDSFKYQGLAFSMFFICIALTSDMICFFFIPVQYIFFAASTYVWVQYVWYTFADKGVCVPTAALCCLVVYAEGALRGERLQPWRPLAAHCVGYPAVTLGFSVKSYVGRRLRLRTQRHVRRQNDFYFQLMRDALPESALDQSQQQPPKEAERSWSQAAESPAHANMNGSAGRRRCGKPELNGHCVADIVKLEKQSRDKSATHTHAHNVATSVDDERSDAVRGVIKSSRCDKKEASTLKEEKRRSKNKDKDKESSDSHKSTEQTQVVKEVESTKESVKNKECNGYKEKDKEKEREREAKEREREREKERERELREARSCSEELKRVRAELAAALRSEQDARRALAAAAANDRQRRADLAQLRHAHHALQHKVSTWRGTNSTSERRAGDERRGSRASREAAAAATAAAAGARQARTMSGDCDSARCAARRAALDADAAGLRVELQRVRDTLAVVQRDLAHANEQLEAAKASAAEESAGSARLAALQDRAAHLQRSLSAETRVKLDLLSALGGAKRHILIQDGTISRQEKEIEELKAQMLAVMPTEYVTVGSGTSKLRLETQLDPNASVYTPKQLCSDA